MALNCPNCGEKVPASHINIQKMTAVCPACDTVFSFDVPETQKAKRRKVKQPPKLMLNDAGNLHMAFHTNFRLAKDGDFVSSAMLSFGMGLIAVLLISTGRAPLLVTLAFTFITLAAIYRAALTAANKTHIEMDDDTIKVSRKPLPSPFDQGHDVSLAGVTAIKYEETPLSKKEAYDMPRYMVWAETADGTRRVIVNDVIEDYAVFIAQRLEERLMESLDVESDVAHLEEDATDEQVDIAQLMEASRSKARRS